MKKSATALPTGTALPDRNNTDGFDQIQLIVSRDLEHWNRLGDRQPFIPLSDVSSGRVGVYELNEDGTARDPSTLTDQDRSDLDDGSGAVCLAVQRRDGFVSFDASDAGTILTKPLKLFADRLFLNLDAPPLAKPDSKS